MELSQKDFQVLEALDSHEIETQRQLAAHADISLGQVNYVLKSLLDKGLVKIGKFRKNPNKIRYVYLLTPKGIEAKSKLAVSFVLTRLKKYQNLRKKLYKKLTSVQQKGHCKVLFAGPWLIYDLIVSVVREMEMELTITGHISNLQELEHYSFDAFDIVLMMDGSLGSFKKISETTGVPKEKLLPLW
jgi:MarR family transcriptional regulator, temperature-dependent positive regulator of motility